MSEPPTSEDWGDLSFEGTRRSHLRRTLSLTPAERLAWLEEAIDFAVQAGALPKKERGPKKA